MDPIWTQYGPHGSYMAQHKGQFGFHCSTLHPPAARVFCDVTELGPTMTDVGDGFSTRRPQEKSMVKWEPLKGDQCFC